jgi:hypothetical protein
VRLRRVAALLVIAVTLACGRSFSPEQPAPLTDCTILGVVVPSNLEVGETRRLSAYLEHCRPMYLPLDPSQVSWQSLDPAVASVSGDNLTAAARGPAIIQGTYGRMTQQALVIAGTNPLQTAPSSPVRFRIYGSPSMSVYQRAVFGGFAVMADGTVIRVSSASWQSSNPAAAGLAGQDGGSAERAVDAFSAGATTISATYQGSASALSVQVHQN